jgi:hypothetical protein
MGRLRDLLYGVAPAPAAPAPVASTKATKKSVVEAKPVVEEVTEEVSEEE